MISADRAKLIKNSATIPLPLDHPVSGPDDWEKIRHWYTFTEDRVDRGRLTEQKKRRDSGQLTVIHMPGAFDEPRQLLGEEGLCIACYEEPEMLHDMLETFTDTAVRVIERVGAVVVFLGVGEAFAVAVDSG